MARVARRQIREWGNGFAKLRKCVVEGADGVGQPDGNGGAVFGTAAPSRAGVTREYYWNNNAYRVIQPESARTNVFASAEFDVNSRITLFADASLYRAHSVTYREPDGITQSTDGFIIVPATNPFNPFGTRFWSPR